MRIILRDQSGVVMWEGPMPGGWISPPDVVKANGWLFRNCGRADGIVSYIPASCATIPAEMWAKATTSNG